MKLSARRAVPAGLSICDGVCSGATAANAATAATEAGWKLIEAVGSTTCIRDVCDGVLPLQTTSVIVDMCKMGA